ncbi:hypothetical protein [Labrys neptuniae]
MAEPLKKDEALAAAVREAFQRHMENARQAAEALREKQAAATAQRSAAIPVRDTKLTVPQPANQAAPVRSEEKPAPAPAAAKSTPASLDRLVALASPPKEVAVAPEPPRPVELEAKLAPSPEPTPSPEPAPPSPPPAVEVQAETKPAEKAEDDGFDFGEALFIEIAPDVEKKAAAEPPKLPKAASLDTPAREEQRVEATETFEFRGPPSRERPRMSTVSPTAAPPEDLDLRGKGAPATARAPAPALPAPAPAEDRLATVPQAPARKSTRFGVNPAVNANQARSSKQAWTKIRIPPSWIASAALAAGIAVVGGYFWANQDKLQALGTLIAPPASAPPETKVAAAPPTAVKPAPTVNAPAAPAPTAAAAPAPAPQGATRSVNTIVISVDEIDQAIQNSRELLANGDAVGARQVLETYRAGSDARALFALAETYDPAIVKDGSQADAAQAKAFYEAAAKAGSKDSAERLARLALLHTN